MDLMDMLTQQLGAGGVGQISQRLGVDERTAGTAVSAAIPVLVAALAKNSSQGAGASALANALDRDHDGSILNDLSGYLGSTQGNAGAAILGHVLGGRQAGAEVALGQASGLDPAQMRQIMVMLAPVVMGALGKAKRERGLSADDLGSMLGQQRQRVERQAPGAGSLLNSILDRDGDGSALNDVAGMLGGFLGNRR